MADDLDPAFAGVTHDLCNVEVGIGLREVERLAAAPVLPAFVPAFEQHPLNIVGRREVDMAFGVFGRRAVAVVHRPRLDAEVHAPPHADVLHRADPARIPDLRRFVQIENQRRIDQPHGIGRQLHGAPRGRKFIADMRFRAVGQRREIRFERKSVRLAKRHFGKVVQGRFVDTAVEAADLERRGVLASASSLSGSLR